MIDTPISRVRLPDLARLGRFPGWAARVAAHPARCASCAGHLTDATSIAEASGTRPRAASPRPGTCDLVASIIKRRALLRFGSRR
jgi:hypothetical protein